MSTVRILCNEIRKSVYVMAVPPDVSAEFNGLFCERERCPFAIVGEAKKNLLE